MPRDPVSAGGGTRAIIAALAANLGIAVTKFVAFAADRLVVDAGRGDPLGRRLGQPGAAAARRQAGPARQATPEHPFGYGRERYIYAFIVSIVLFSVGGLFALYEGYHKSQHPEPIDELAVGADRGAGRGDRPGVASRSAPRSTSPTRSAATRRWVQLHPPGQGARAAGRAAGGLRRADRPGLRPVRRRR